MANDIVLFNNVISVQVFHQLILIILLEILLHFVQLDVERRDDLLVLLGDDVVVPSCAKMLQVRLRRSLLQKVLLSLLGVMRIFNKLGQMVRSNGIALAGADDQLVIGRALWVRSMIIVIMVNFACFLPGLDVGGLDRRSAIARVVRSRGGLNVEQNNFNVNEVNAIFV